MKQSVWSIKGTEVAYNLRVVVDLRFVGFLVQNLGVNCLVFKELDQIEQRGEENDDDYVAFPIPHTALQPALIKQNKL